MTIQQIIEEQMKELAKRWGGFITIPIPDVIKSFLSSYTRKLIEALGEELINEGERIHDNGAYGDEGCEGDACHFMSGHLVARDVLEGQQAKLKEIISSLI